MAKYAEFVDNDGNCENKTNKKSLSKISNKATDYLTSNARQAFT